MYDSDIIIKLFNYFPQKIFYKDKNLNYIFGNENYVQDLKIKDSEIKGKTDFDIYPKEAAEKHRSIDTMILNSGETHEEEEEREIDGKKYWVHLVKLPIKEKGQNIGVLGIYWDITKQKQAEQNLRESEERFRKLSEASFEGIIIHEGGMAIEVNAAFEGMFGYKSSEFTGKNTVDLLVTPETIAIVKEHIRLNSEEPYEAVGRRKDGTTFPMEIHGKSIMYQGRHARVTAIRDISEFKKTEQELRNNLDTVERMNKLMVGRELKMIELKTRIRELEQDCAQIKDRRNPSWKEKFKEGEEIEEIFVREINGAYMNEINKSDLPETIKEECRKLLLILIKDSVRHLDLFRKMEEEVNGQ